MAHAEQQQQTYFKRLSAPAKNALSMRESFSIEEFAFIWAGFEPYSGGYGGETERQAVREEYLREVKLYEKVLSQKMIKAGALETDTETGDMMESFSYWFNGAPPIPNTAYVGGISNPIRNLQFPVDAYRRFLNDRGQEFPLDLVQERDTWEIDGITRSDLQEIVESLPKVGCILRGLAGALHDNRGVDIAGDDLKPGDVTREEDSAERLGRSVPLKLIEIAMRNRGLTRSGRDGGANKTVLEAVHLAVFPERAPGPRTSGKE